jgi:hypothetical protein
MFNKEEKKTVISMDMGGAIEPVELPKEEEKVEEQVVENKPVEEPIKEEPKEEYHWILNTNTKKVHIPTCNSVKQMKEKNKKESDLSPEELKSKGYTACKNCNPFK